MLDPTLSREDAGRAAAALDRLRRAGLEGAVTGGLAIGWHGSRGGRAPPATRPLNDIDLVVAGLRSIPDGLGEGFEILHVHPDARPGRMLVQAHDRATGLRVDVFGARGDTLSRCLDTSLRGTALRAVSLEDVVARLASLLLDLALGEAVAPKHARDFSALVPHVGAAAMARPWADHRRDRQPPGFAEARACVLDLLRERPGLLAVPASPYRVSPCPRCRPHRGLRPGPG